MSSLPPLSPITSRSSPPRSDDIDVTITKPSSEGMSLSQAQREKGTDRTAFTLQLPSTTTIGTLRSLINLRTNIPQETISIHHGPEAQKVTLLTKTLADFLSVSSHGPEPSPLSFSFKVETVPRKPKKGRCTFAGCNEKCAPIVGDCTFCPGKFCGKHRTLPMHLCPGRDESKAAAWQRNADILTKNATISTKGL